MCAGSAYWCLCCAYSASCFLFPILCAHAYLCVSVFMCEVLRAACVLLPLQLFRARQRRETEKKMKLTKQQADEGKTNFNHTQQCYKAYLSVSCRHKETGKSKHTVKEGRSREKTFMFLFCLVPQMTFGQHTSAGQQGGCNCSQCVPVCVCACVISNHFDAQRGFFPS